MLSDIEFETLREFAQSGGTLLITGIPGERRSDGTIRSIEDIIEKLGFYESASIKTEIQSGESSPIEIIKMSLKGSSEIRFNGYSKIIDDLEYAFMFKADEENIIMRTNDGIPTGICHQIGKGKIIWLSTSTNMVKVQRTIGAERVLEEGKNKFINAPVYAAKMLQDSIGRILNCIVEEPILDTSGLPDWWLTTCYLSSTGNNLIIHVLNTSGILPSDANKKVSHDDLIDAFCEGSISPYSQSDIAFINVSWRNSNTVKKVLLHTPEREDELILNWQLNDKTLTICINCNAFCGYGIIDIQF